MSAAVLREAAALMRERAEAEPSVGWTKVDFNEGDGYPFRPLWGISNDAYFNPPADEDEPWLAVEIHTGTEATAEHIASWHPAVALAVADWLDEALRFFEGMAVTHYYQSEPNDLLTHPLVKPALAVATAYLGRTS